MVVYNMEWEAIGNTLGTWGDWEHQQTCKLGEIGNNQSWWEQIGNHICNTLSTPSRKHYVHPPHYQPPKMKKKLNILGDYNLTSLVPRISIPTYLHYHFLTQLNGRGMNCGFVDYHP
jgi:hypothetical protein